MIEAEGFRDFVAPDISDIEPEYLADLSQEDPAGWDREANGPFLYPTARFAEAVFDRFDAAFQEVQTHNDRVYRRGWAEAMSDNTPIMANGSVLSVKAEVPVVQLWHGETVPQETQEQASPGSSIAV